MDNDYAHKRVIYTPKYRWSAYNIILGKTEVEHREGSDFRKTGFNFFKGAKRKNKRKDDGIMDWGEAEYEIES